MIRLFTFLSLISIMMACSPGTPEKKKQEEKATADQAATFDHIALLLTPGLPKGFTQRDYTISSDGKVAFTTIELPSFSRRFLIQVNVVEKLAVLAPISGKYNDFEPFITPGDSLLLFSSDRPLFEGDTSRDFNLWYVPLEGKDLGEPRPFDTIINTEADEYYPSMNRNGDLYFTAVYEAGKGKDDIYRAMRIKGGYQQPEIQKFCEPDYYEFNAYVFPDDNALLFSSYGRKEEVGGGDLYLVQRDSSGEWGEVVMLENRINTRSLDFSPFVKGDTLFFTSKRQDASWETRRFDYLAQISAHADSAAIGTQGIYIIPLDKVMPQQ